MRHVAMILLLTPLIAAAVLARAETAILPYVPDGAQAVSLAGEPLYSAEPGDETIAKLHAARKDYDEDPNDADNIIWLGRRLAYLTREGPRCISA